MQLKLFVVFPSVYILSLFGKNMSTGASLTLMNTLSSNPTGFNIKNAEGFTTILKYQVFME